MIYSKRVFSKHYTDGNGRQRRRVITEYRLFGLVVYTTEAV